MATPHLQRLKPGQQPSAAEWNRLVDLVSRQGLATGTAFGDIGVAQGAGGIQILDGRDRGHWARIGARGTGAAYAHTHAAPDGDGTFTDLPQTSEYEWGTTTSAPAREINGDTSVPSGTYAWIWPDPTAATPGYLFANPVDCCGWSADHYSFLGNALPNSPHFGVFESSGGYGTGWIGSDIGPGGTFSAPPYVTLWWVPTWEGPPFTLGSGGRSGLEVSVPANETHWVDATCAVAFQVQAPTGWDTSALGTHHRSHQLYVEAAVFEITNVLAMTRVTGWQPVARGQLVPTTYGMAPTGDRVPTLGPGFDAGIGAFRGPDDDPIWSGMTSAKFLKTSPLARRYGWVVRVFRESVWPYGHCRFGAHFSTGIVCCDGTTPAAPTVAPPPPPPRPDPGGERGSAKKKVNYLEQFTIGGDGTSAPSTTPGGV